MTRLFSLVPALSLLILTGALSGGCILSDDVDDFEIKLPQKEFHFDTGNPDTAPPLEVTSDGLCISSPADSCAAVSDDLFCNSFGNCEVVDPNVLPALPCDVDTDCSDLLGDAASCNQTDGACQFTPRFQLHTRVELANEVPELADLGGSQFTRVRFSYVRMYVAENTFAVETPEVELYIAPDAVASLFLPNDPHTLDPDVFLVGVIDPIAAATSGHTVEVVLDPMGDDVLTEYCRTPDVPFKFFVYAEMEPFRAGDSIPEGALTLQIDSAAVVGLN